jgi:cytosine/adenosine deaminase-related metal-dependent hydrolase
VVLPGEGPEQLRVGEAVVHIAGGKIERVSEGRGEPADEDLGDRLISPAFVNAHTHLAMCFARGLEVPDAAGGNRVESFFFELESRLTHEQVRAFARMGAYESLLAGVGTVWEHYYHPLALVEALRETGLCGVVAPTLQDLAGPGKAQWEANLEVTLGLHQEDPASRAGVYAALGPHATDTVSATLWTQVAELAARHELPMHFHLSQSVEEFERARARHSCSPTAWLSRLGVLDAPVSAVLAHAIFTGRDDLETLDAARHCLVWCPRSAAFFGFAARPGVWEELGANWVLGSDAAASNDSMDPRAELFELHRQRTAAVSASEQYSQFLSEPSVESARALWAKRAKDWAESETWTGADKLLSRVWTRPGRLHPSFRAGAIEAGALANLIVWELDHPATWPASNPLHALCFSAPSGGAAIHNLMTLGQWRGDSGHYVESICSSEAYREAKREADKRLKELLDDVA